MLKVHIFANKQKIDLISTGFPVNMRTLGDLEGGAYLHVQREGGGGGGACTCAMCSYGSVFGCLPFSL